MTKLPFVCLQVCVDITCAKVPGEQGLSMSFLQSPRSAYRPPLTLALPPRCPLRSF